MRTPHYLESGHLVIQDNTIIQDTTLIIEPGQLVIRTLYSGLLNGDGIYDALDEIDKDDNIIAYVYSRAFIYAFIVLFIYFVLNLFTSLVISAYEASQVSGTILLT